MNFCVVTPTELGKHWKTDCKSYNEPSDEKQLR